MDEVTVVLSWEHREVWALLGGYGDRDPLGHPTRIYLCRPTALEALVDVIRKWEVSR